MNDINDILGLNNGNFGKNTDRGKIPMAKRRNTKSAPGTYILKRLQDTRTFKSANDAAQLHRLDALISEHGGYKPKLDTKKVQKWKWTSFINPARADKAEFYHWAPVSHFQQPYPFAAFNQAIEICEYSDMEYATHLDGYKDWTKEATDHLFDLCRRFDLRFPVIHDRWDRECHGQRSIEDLKDRYYNVKEIGTKLKTGTIPSKMFRYDADHERKRKLQLEKLLSRTAEEVQEEKHLKAQLKIIAAAKKVRNQKNHLAHLERERKIQELQMMMVQKGYYHYDSLKRKVEPSVKETKTEPKPQKDKIVPYLRKVKLDPKYHEEKIKPKSQEEKIVPDLRKVQIEPKPQEEKIVADLRKVKIEPKSQVKKIVPALRKVEIEPKSQVEKIVPDLRRVKIEPKSQDEKIVPDLRNVKIGPNLQNIKVEPTLSIADFEAMQQGHHQEHTSRDDFPHMETDCKTASGSTDEDDRKACQKSQIRWPITTEGATICSEKMQLPRRMGEKKTRAIKSFLKTFGLDSNDPIIATVGAAAEFNGLRSDILEMNELRLALADSTKRIHSLAARYKKKTHVKLELPEAICGRNSTRINSRADNADKKITSGKRMYTSDL